jgi:iron(III) transport system permease protein
VGHGDLRAPNFVPTAIDYTLFEPSRAPLPIISGHHGMNGHRQTSGLAIVAAGCAMVTLALLLRDPRQAALMGTTVQLAAEACLLSLPIGAVLAFLLVRTDLPGRTAAGAVLGGMLFMPLYLQATAWDAGFGQLGWYPLVQTDVASPLLGGWRGAVWIHALAAVPWVVLVLGAGLWFVEPELEEQALLDGSAVRVLLSVTLPRLLPAVGLAALWVLLSVATEMTVTDLYRVRTYAEELYAGFALGDDLQTAWGTVLPGLTAQAVLVAVTLGGVTSAVGPAQAPGRRPWIFPLGRWRLPALVLVALVLALIAGVPLGNLVYKAGAMLTRVGDAPVRSWSLSQFSTVLARSVREDCHELRWTTIISGTTATLAVALGALLAWLARCGGLRAWPASAVAAVGLSVPGPLVGLAVIWLLDREQPPGLVWLYDRTIAAPVLALVVRVLPLALLLCWCAWRSLSQDVLDSAACDGAGPWAQFRRVAMPQRWAALGSAWLAAFAVAAGDLSCSILVVPPGMTTVSIRVFGLVHAGVDQHVAGLCLVLLAGYALLAGLILALFLRVLPARPLLARPDLDAPAGTSKCDLDLTRTGP